MAILRVKDSDGNVTDIPAIQGEKGDPGKSAFETAAAAGYTGTEADFAADLNGIAGKAKKATEPTEGNLAALDAEGNPVDSGKKAADFLPSTTVVPVITFGTEGITAGSASTEPEGALHFVIV